jgi:hypothetical protein
MTVALDVLTANNKKVIINFLMSDHICKDKIMLGNGALIQLGLSLAFNATPFSRSNALSRPVEYQRNVDSLLAANALRSEFHVNLREAR